MPSTTNILLQLRNRASGEMAYIILPTSQCSQVEAVWNSLTPTQKAEGLLTTRPTLPGDEYWQVDATCDVTPPEVVEGEGSITLASLLVDGGTTGFAHFQLTNPGESNVVVDNFNAASYSGSPRRFFVEGRYVGKGTMPPQTLANYGGVQQVSCKRWANNETSNFSDNSIPIETHTVMVVTRGPQHSQGEMPAPPTYTPALGRWNIDIHNQIPAFGALVGKICAMYRLDREATLDQLFARGMTHVWGQNDAGWGGLPAGDAAQNAKRQMTSPLFHITGQIDSNGNLIQLSYDNMGQQGFDQLSLQSIFTSAHYQPQVGLLFLDVEKIRYNQSDLNEPFWGLDFTYESKVRWYIMMKRYKELNPTTRIANMYQLRLPTYSFLVEGRPQPLEYLKYYGNVDPTANSYTPFNFPGGTFTTPSGQTITYPAKANASLKEVFDTWTLDAYIKTWSNEENSKSTALYGCYSIIHDGLMLQKWYAAERVIMYFWILTDNDGTGRVWVKTPTGVASYELRSSAPVWMFMHLTYQGFMRFGGMKWWNQEFMMSSDPSKPYAPNGFPPVNPQWEPTVSGAPSPFLSLPAQNDPERYHRYPPFPHVAPRSSFLAMLRMKDIESLWNKEVNPAVTHSYPPFSLDGGSTWINPQAVGDICHKAHNQQPIVDLYSSPEGFALYTCHPFNTTATITIRVRFTATLTVDVEVIGQQPALRGFSPIGQAKYSSTGQRNF